MNVFKVLNKVSLYLKNYTNFVEPDIFTTEDTEGIRGGAQRIIPQFSNWFIFILNNGDLSVFKDNHLELNDASCIFYIESPE